MHDSIFDRLYSSTTFLAAIFAANVVALFKAWPLIMARINERHRDKEAGKSGDWSRLRAEISRLDERCDHLQREVDECREREGEWMKRAIAAEAYQIGRGDAAQTVTIIESRKRISENGDDR